MKPTRLVDSHYFFTRKGEAVLVEGRMVLQGRTQGVVRHIVCETTKGTWVYVQYCEPESPRTAILAELVVVRDSPVALAQTLIGDVIDINHNTRGFACELFRHPECTKFYERV